LHMNSEGRVDINGLRPWVGKNGQPFINVGGKAVPVTNALLQKDEWIAYDSAVRQVATIRLNAVNDLRNAGLIFNAGDLGSTIAEWDSASDMTAAEINMAGVTMSEKDSQAFTLSGVPIPVIRKDFQVNVRRLLASRRMGQGVDVTGAQTATRLVAERSEDMLFNGVSITTGGYTVYGYTNHPDRATGSVTDWSLGGTTGKTVVDEVLAMIEALEAKKHYGPYMLYVPGNFWPKLKTDYSDNKGDNTIYDRIRAISQIIDVKVSDQLADNNVVLVQMTSDVIDLAVAQDVMSVQWERGDGMQTNFAVLAAWAPRIKPDYNGELGIAHYSV
ncbi:major capsid protein, partial [Zhongshania sp.]|uniref:major capsid protein n=1 Tax=Zhongshania sp. TaxID=1971902 RepID=UPI003564ADCD